MPNTGDGAAIPVVAGLTIGIAVVVLFASLFGSSSPIIQRKAFADVSITGLKEVYRTGEKIDFTIRAKGYGTNCGNPSVTMVDTQNPSNMINLFDIIMDYYNCDPEPHSFDKTWRLADIGILHDITPASGHYKVAVSYGQTMEKEFDVITSNKPTGSENMPTGNIVTVDIGSKPQENIAQTGMGSSLMTKYLPVNITQAVNIIGKPVRDITIYPIVADWDGIVRPDNNVKWLMQTQNNTSIPFKGYQTLSLRAVNATCTEPYFVKVLGSGIGEDSIQLENVTAPVSSIIYWGDTLQGSFDQPRNGTFYYTQAGYGIVPENFNNNHDTYRTNGAGNQDLSGVYHLSFATFFYPATIHLPQKATMISSHEITCNINRESMQVQDLEFPYIYIYDIRFRVE